MQLNCKLFLESNAEHCQQVYTGFADLAAEKVINLEIIHSNYTVSSYGKAVVKVILNNRYTIIYDLYDGKELLEIQKIDKIDFYFKRSFDREYVQKLGLLHKVYPYGLNYLVYSKNTFWIKRTNFKNDFINSLKTLIRSNKFLSKNLNILDSYYTCDVRNFEKMPLIDSNPKILFLTQTWKPDHVSDSAKKEERIIINNTRAKIIRILREAYGKNFIGGFKDDEYTRKNYRDCIVPKYMTNKNDYLKHMHSASICIATSGLEKSIGWKFAEYVAASKAIVTERLHFELPGLFVEGKNYLEFTSYDECVSSINKLIEDRHLRYTMMQANHEYYQSYVKPINIIFNTLIQIMKNEKS